MVPTFDTRVKADEAQTDGMSVSAVILKDGTPKYFLVPSDTSEEEMRRLSFEIRNGRTMTSFEDSLLHIAEQARA
jgi:hypothetical protein